MLANCQKDNFYFLKLYPIVLIILKFHADVISNKWYVLLFNIGCLWLLEKMKVFMYFLAIVYILLYISISFHNLCSFFHWFHFSLLICTNSLYIKLLLGWKTHFSGHCSSYFDVFISCPPEVLDVYVDRPVFLWLCFYQIFLSVFL